MSGVIVYLGGEEQVIPENEKKLLGNKTPIQLEFFYSKKSNGKN
jgi:hypothetical protein